MKQNYTFKRVLSAVILLLASTLSWAYDFEVNGIYYNINEDGETVEVTYKEWGNLDYYQDIVIPPTVSYDEKTYSVTSIGEYAFSGSSFFLNSVNIPNTVTSIGNYAFWGCSGLTFINIPENVTNIGERAFSSCESLTSMTVSADNPVYDSREGCNAIIETASNTLISGCKNTSIPNSVTNIGDYAFEGRTDLTSIEIPGSVTSIGNYAFSDCVHLTSIHISENVTNIGWMAFDGRFSLESITVSEGNPVYDSREECNAIIETATNTLIKGCKNTIIPESVVSIEEYAFGHCYSLTSIEIPEGVTRIGIDAFSGCSDLTSIDIPASVTNIGSSAFGECYSLTIVLCRAEHVPELGWWVFDTVPTSEATLYVPASALEAYKEADQWSKFGTILPLDGDATSIATTSQDKAVRAPYYTLDGKPAASPTRKGIYVTNGKKVVMK